MVATAHSLCVLVTAAATAAAPPPAAQPPADSALPRARRLLAESKFDSAAAALDALVAARPADGQAWLALGSARRGQGRVDDAGAALRRAAELPRTAPAAWRALFLLYADARRPDDAYRWFDELRRRGAVDLTGLAGSREAAALRGDARFAVLFPAGPDAFARPFAEREARVIHEWRGEAAGDGVGWIARPVGDVDGDGVPEVVVSAPGNPPFGAGRGKVYVYAGRTGALLWKREGEPNARLGIGLEGAGDVDGDGAPDVVAGAPGLG